MFTQTHNFFSCKQKLYMYLRIREDTFYCPYEYKSHKEIVGAVLNNKNTHNNTNSFSVTHTHTHSTRSLTTDTWGCLHFSPHNPKTLGSIPWWGRVRHIFSVPPTQLLCRLVCAWPPFVCAARTQICVHVKDPISICRKRVGLTAGGMETRKHCTQG